MGTGAADCRGSVCERKVPQMNPLERTTERRWAKKWTLQGYIVVKMGRGGFPDDLILMGGARHFWAEFKTSYGRLTAAQKRRIPRLEAIGEVVRLITEETL